MFSNAYEHATGFTRPFIVSVVDAKDKVDTSIGAWVLISPTHGLTAAHVVAPLVEAEQRKKAYDDYELKVADINSQDLDQGKKKSRIRRLRNGFDPSKGVKAFSPWLGKDGLVIGPTVLYGDADLAVFEVGNVAEVIGGDVQYPRFKRASGVTMGTSLLRIGYPFHSIETSFDADVRQFRFREGALPIPIFPMDGISTRQEDRGTSKGGYPVQFLETSTPALLGQSGGPVVDRDGVVWGITTHTWQLPLGFSPELELNGKTVVEHQFLNVGASVHPRTLEAILQRHSITVEWVD